MTLVCGNTRFIRIFPGFPGEGASNDSGLMENVDFQCFVTLYLRNLRKYGQHSPSIIVAFPLTPKYVTLNDPEWPFYLYVKFCFLARMSMHSCHCFTLIIAVSVITKRKRGRPRTTWKDSLERCLVHEDDIGRHLSQGNGQRGVERMDCPMC